MNILKPRYTMEEFARRGDELYERDIRPTLTEHDDGKIIAIDIESGEFEIGDDDFEATERLLARQPDAQIWLVIAGDETAYRIGAYEARS